MDNQNEQKELLEIPAFLKREPGDAAKVASIRRETTIPSFTRTEVRSLSAEPLKPVQRSAKLIGWDVKERLEDYIDNDTLDKVFELITHYKSKSGLVSYLKTTFNEAKLEIENARSEETAEYFETVTDEELEKRLVGYIRILQDIDSIEQNKRAGRKTTVRNKVTKAVSNVSYKVSDPDLKVSSIDPTSIVGTKGLVTFNVKSRRVSYFVAADDTGLQISGTTLKNFDEEQSMAKNLRKPEEQLQHFRQATGIRRVNVLLKDSINGKIFRVGGRLNKDTLLLKVFK